MPTYRQRPIEIEARQYDPEIDPDHAADVLSWCGAETIISGDGFYLGQTEECIIVNGDYVIKGPAGFTVVRSGIFEQLYEPVAEEKRGMSLKALLTGKRIGKFS